MKLVDTDDKAALVIEAMQKLFDGIIRRARERATYRASLHGHGRVARVGDFVVIQSDAREIRGILLGIHYRKTTKTDRELRGESATGTVLYIQEDPFNGAPMQSGASSFYIDKKDRVLHVAPNFLNNLEKTIQFHRTHHE